MVVVRGRERVSVVFWVVIVLLSVLWWKTEGLVKLPVNVTIPAVLVIGDSIMDTGNNNYNPTTLARCNYRPYGKDFEGGVPTGRFGNGKVPSDIIVEELGIKELLPAYLDPNLQSQDLPTGVCFASGGAGFDPLTSKLASAISLSDQVELLRHYKERLKALVGEDRTDFIISNSVVFVVAGSNDISNTYFLSHARQVQYDVPAYTDLMVTSASDLVKELYEAGLRRIGVFSAPPIGCVPFQRTVAGGAERKCVDRYNEAAELFNSKLAKELASLNRELPSSRIVYIDVYSPLLDVIVNYQQNGFKVADRGCCGTGEIEVAELCNHLQQTCADDSEYVFWDSFHPTETAYRKLISPLLSFNDIANTYFLFPARQLHYDRSSFLQLLVTSASPFIKGLYEGGARRIAVLSAPPIGCAPFQRTLAAGAEGKCVDKYNEAAELFNSKHAKELASLNRELPSSRIAYIDVYGPLLDVILNYHKYGDRGRCGTGKIEVGPLCNHLVDTCPDAWDYVFWDSVHPSQTATKSSLLHSFANTSTNSSDDPPYTHTRTIFHFEGIVNYISNVITRLVW